MRRTGVPSDAGNLAWRAAEAFFGAVRSKIGVAIRLTKRIPVAAGLGGGSADAAAVLLALNRMVGDRLAMPRLESLGQKLGADVPFFLHQRPSLATGIGEKLNRVDGLPDYPLVLIKPPLNVSTRWVYQSLKLTRGESRIKLARFMERPWQLREVMENDLETVTLSAYPVLAQIKEWLLQEGAIGALMSGSGPTVYGVFRDGSQAAALAAQAKCTWEGCWVAATRVCGNAAVNIR